MTVSYISPCGIHVLDGGFGSLLEELGYNVDNSELWSGGANIDSLDLKSVEIARDAIKSSRNPSTQLVGSIGPYATYLRDGSEYTGAYTKEPNFDPQIIVDYYLAQAKPLIEAGINCLVFETIPSLKEVVCVGKVLDQLDESVEAWIVVSCQDGSTTRSGDNFKDVVKLTTYMPKVTFVGINCASPLHITALLENAAATNVDQFDKQTNKMSHRKPYVLYPNSAEEYNTELRKFEGSPKIDMIAELIPEWYKLGARIFGGCCRVLPSHIQKIAAACRKLKKDIENNN
ncbi:homocysteine s-methyltransferase domain-containing protein [Ditylenchus destructor]|uniref:Homocysteine s-methyltransferase domain-containing protein n=1 Tax=Ditylenchus destructor TaxID=166010 RepID=A0AAD4NFK5_9BILA|nr:homocysteine s-methyltransferase domain-containing protein [Ditylenchus destructor]